MVLFFHKNFQIVDKAQGKITDVPLFMGHLKERMKNGRIQKPAFL